MVNYGYKINFLALPYGSYNASTLKIAKELNLEGVLLANNYYSNGVNKATGKINRILMPNIADKELANYLKYFDF